MMILQLSLNLTAGLAVVLVLTRAGISRQVKPAVPVFIEKNLTRLIPVKEDRS